VADGQKRNKLADNDHTNISGPVSKALFRD
jgi:hypothetical protein